MVEVCFKYSCFCLHLLSSSGPIESISSARLKAEGRQMRRIWSLSPSTLQIKSRCCSGNNHFKCLQKVTSYEGTGRRLGSAEVDCSSGNDLHSVVNAWKDSPFGVVWQPGEIADAVDGEVVATGSPGSISTDSRIINPGEWFLPLVGPNFDGHQFLQQALDRGCAGCIGRAVSAEWPRGFIRVEGDTLRSLHGLATWVRRRFDGPVVGITGSTGKTTARAMTALALESLGTVHQTHGNLNNHIGLPLTLLKLPSTSSACVLEMGMSHPGEIQVLAEIARPHVRVLLNVGPVHMKNFGSLEDVAAAKAELLKTGSPGDVCVLNADDPLVMNLALPRGVQVVLFGTKEGCHLKIANAQATRGGRAMRIVLEQFHPASTWVGNFSSGSQILKHLRENLTKPEKSEFRSSGSTAMNDESKYRSDLLSSIRKSTYYVQPNSKGTFETTGRSSCSNLALESRVAFEISSPGLHLALNACSATAVAIALGVPLGMAGNSLSKFSPVGNRSRWEQAGGIQLIDDTYNSNPLSLQSGLTLLASMECEGRRVALLGDMLELGTVSQKAHLEALSLCKQLNLDMMGVVGPLFSETACSKEFDKGNCVFAIFKDSDELAAKTAEILRPGDVVLVKGSRGMKMEMVADAIRTMGRVGQHQYSESN